MGFSDFLGGAVGGVLDYFGQQSANNANRNIARETNTFSAKQAQLNRDWQERMSDTSWQRGVADMRAAGINPMLAFSQGGASTPGGSSASGTTGAPQQKAFSAHSAVESMLAKAQLDNLHATNRQIDSQTALNNASATTAVAQARAITAGTPTKQVESDFMSDLRNTYTTAKGAAGVFGKWLGNTLYDVTHPKYGFAGVK